MNEFLIQLNYFGLPITSAEISHLNRDDPFWRLQKSFIENLLQIPVSALTNDVLERYVEVSSSEVYQPIVPHSDKLLAKIFTPLKSAKRCYCLEEYLATIELCSHVGEMLCTLVWKVTPISFSGIKINSEFEKSIFGSLFENLSQEKRIKVLSGFKLIDSQQNEDFTFLRKVRKNYFHLWSGDIQNLKQDAAKGFLCIMKLIRSILQIEISKSDAGKLTLNPLILDYLLSNNSEAEKVV